MALFVLRKAENFLLDLEKGALGGRQDPDREGLEGCTEKLGPFRETL